jgi:hypothetical protein
LRTVSSTTKQAQVTNYLIENRQIDSWTAIKKFGATRLSAIIYNLRNAGYEINSEQVTGTDRNNDNCKFVVYNMIATPEGKLKRKYQKKDAAN